MANSLGTLQAAQLIMQRALTLCFTGFPMLRTFAKGFKELDGRVAQMGLGQTAITRKLGDSVVGNFGDAAAGVTATDVSVRLSNFRQIYHKFTVEEINQAGNINLLDLIALPVGIKLAQSITGAVAAQVCRANFNTTKNSQAPYLSVAAGWTRANTILPLAKMANERGIPSNMSLPTINGQASFADANRFAIINSDVEAALLGDQMIVSEMNNPANAQAIRSGMLPVVSGFQFAPYPVMPNTDGNLIGFAGNADALGYVARAPSTPFDLMPDLPRTALMAIVQDPTSGFQVLIIIEGQVADLSLHMRVVWLDGLAVGNTDNLIRLINGAISGSAGTITGLTVINPGYAYRDGAGAYAAPTVSFSGGGGTGAAATAAISTNGAVTGLTITNAGSGYTSPPTVVFTPSTNGGAGSAAGIATAVASVGGLN